MNSQFDVIRDQQKQNWNQFSGGWKKWDEFNMNFLFPMGQKIIEELQLKASDHVLDVATGTGEPGLSIAKIVSQGKVTGQDLSDGMLITAKEHAAAKGLKNFETVCCDVCELPFTDNTFDNISCRMGFMFFPDVQKAADEMTRVLKPGGHIATSVWGGPPGNLWIAGLMSVIAKNIEMPAPPPGSPGMFRCAAPGYIASLFERAGLKNIKETIVTGEIDYGTFDFYWQMLTEVAAPVVAAMNKSDDATREKIKSEVNDLLKPRMTAGKLLLPYSTIVISAEK